jgi:hypothetical protein
MGGAGQGGQGGSGGGTTPCHPPGLVDAFNGPAVDTSLWVEWSDPDFTIGISSGVLVIAPPAPAVTYGYGNVTSQNSYDLRGCAMWVEVVAIADPSQNGETYFSATVDNDNKASFAIWEDGLYFTLDVGAVTTDTAHVTYSPTQHRWWRLREAGGTISWETSPDGHSWNNRLQAVSPAFMDHVKLRLSAGVKAAATSPGEAQFDNVNLEP